MLRIILFVIVYSGVFGSGANVTVTSGFGDLRPRDSLKGIKRYHFHHGVDLVTRNIWHKPVYYPDDDNGRKNYKPKVVYRRYGNNQTYDLIIGRFDFIHLATVGKQIEDTIKDTVYVIDTTILVSLLEALKIPATKRIKVRRD